MGAPGGLAQDRAERLQSLRAHLQRRLEVDLGSELGPRLGARVAELVAAGELAGPPELVPVRDGWLSDDAVRAFLEFNPQWRPGAPAGTELRPAQQIVETIADFDRQLRERGIELVVAPIPTRLNVYPDALVPAELGESFEGFAPGLTRWLLALVDAGVEVADLLPALAATRGALDAPDSQQPFLRVNTHWAPVGIVAAADHLAARIASAEWFEPGPGGTHVEEERGDLLAFQVKVPVAAAPVLLYERVLDAQGQPAAFRDAGSPVILLGDSFTQMFREESADIGRQLHHRLGFPPDIIFSPAGGPYQSRVTLARRDAPFAGKRLVVWLFTCEALRYPAAWKPGDFSGR